MNTARIVRGTSHDKRNYGLDLLRLIAMLGVVINHMFTQGGILSAPKDIYRGASVWLIEVTVYLSVDCYVIISGYVNYRESNSELRLYRIIELWLVVVFWGLTLNIVDGIYHRTFQLMPYIRAAFPICFDQYWFFSAYFVLFLLFPILNCVWVVQTKEKAIFILFLLFIMLSGYATLISPISDPLEVRRGYGVVWFCFLYLTGAAIRKIGLFISVKKNKLLMVLIICVALTWFSVTFLGDITERLLGHQLGESILFSYNSPTLFIPSVCVVVLFLNISLSKKMIAMVKTLAPGAFGVYIIHMHPIVKEQILHDRFIFISHYHATTIPIVAFVVGITITLFCLILDKGRAYVFKKLKIRERLMRAEERIVEKSYSLFCG